MTAEEPAPDPRPTPTVLAQGEGAVDVVPDAARVVIGVQVASSGLATARDEAASRAETAIAAVKAVDIPARDIQTSGYRVHPLRDVDPDGHPTATRGYQVRNAVTVTVRDLDALPAVLDAATAAGANEVHGPEFFLQHPEAATGAASGHGQRPPPRGIAGRRRRGKTRPRPLHRRPRHARRSRAPHGLPRHGDRRLGPFNSD
jgi:uncharacterized protein YggE